MNSNHDRDSNLVDERESFEALAEVEYRNSDEYTNRDFRMGLAAWQARAARVSAHVADVQDADRLRQWFDCLQDTQGGWLTKEDYALARRLYEQCGMRVPNNVAAIAATQAIPTVDDRDAVNSLVDSIQSAINGMKFDNFNATQRQMEFIKAGARRVIAEVNAAITDQLGKKDMAE